MKKSNKSLPLSGKEEEKLKKEIKNLEWSNYKIEGISILHNIGNRIYGILGLIIAAIGIYSNTWLMLIFIPFSIEMIADIITGKHHFISYRLFKIHPKYKLNKIKSENLEIYKSALEAFKLEEPRVFK